MAEDKSLEELEKELTEDLHEILERRPIAAARESGVHTAEEGKAVPDSDALLKKILVGDEPVTIDVTKTGEILSATWKMQADDLRQLVTTAIASRLRTIEHSDKLQRAYDETQKLLAKSQEELAEYKAKYIALEAAVHADGSTLTMSMSSSDSTAWTPTKIKLESPASAERTAEGTKGDQDDAPRQDMSGRRTTLAPGDQAIFDRNFQSYQETQKFLRELTGGASEMPSPYSVDQMSKLLTSVRKLAESKCGTKTAKLVSTEEGILELAWSILREADVHRDILLEALKQRDAPSMMRAYQQGYSTISQDTVYVSDASSMKELTFQQRIATVCRQDDQLLIAIAESGLTKLSATWRAQCQEKHGKSDQVAGGKTQVGSGLAYLVEAMGHICRLTWDTVIDDLEMIMDSAHVLEHTCNGSIQRMMIEHDKLWSEFVKKHGHITDVELKGLNELIMLRKIQRDRTTPHLVESFEHHLKFHAFDPTKHDLKGALEEGRKVMELLAKDERKHADDRVRGRVELETKNIEKALKAHRAAAGTTHVASSKSGAGGYQEGFVAGTAAVLFAPSDAQSVLTVDFGSSKKKLTDEAENIARFVNRALDTMTKVKDGKMATQPSQKDIESMQGLVKNLESLRERITTTAGGGGKTQTQRDAARRGRSRSSERKETSKDPGDEDCVFWLQGDCKKGADCKFKHDPQRRGSDPDAVSKRFKWYGRTDRGRSKERAGANTASSDSQDQGNPNPTQTAPPCKNENCSNRAAVNGRTGTYYDYCARRCAEAHTGKRISSHSAVADEGEGSDEAGDRQLAEVFERLEDRLGVSRPGRQPSSYAAMSGKRQETFVVETQHSIYPEQGTPRREVDIGEGPDQGIACMIDRKIGVFVQACSANDIYVDCSLLAALGDNWDEDLNFQQNIYQFWPGEPIKAAVLRECEERWAQITSCEGGVADSVQRQADQDRPTDDNAPRSTEHLAPRGTEHLFGIVTPSLGTAEPHCKLRPNEKTEDNADAQMQDLPPACSIKDIGSDGDEGGGTSKAVGVDIAIYGIDIYQAWLTSAFDASQSAELIQSDDWLVTLRGLRALCDNETVRERMIRDEIHWLIHNISVDLGHRPDIARATYQILEHLAVPRIKAGAADNIRRTVDVLEQYHPLPTEAADAQPGSAARLELNEAAGRVRATLEFGEYQKVRESYPRDRTLPHAPVAGLQANPDIRPVMPLDKIKEPDKSRRRLRSVDKQNGGGMTPKSPDSARTRKAQAWKAQLQARRASFLRQSEPRDGDVVEVEFPDFVPAPWKPDPIPTKGKISGAAWAELNQTPFVGRRAAMYLSHKAYTRGYRDRRRQETIQRRINDTVGQDVETGDHTAESSPNSDREPQPTPDPAHARLLRGHIRFHRQERWTRHVKDWIWGSDSEIVTGVNLILNDKVREAQESAADAAVSAARQNRALRTRQRIVGFRQRCRELIATSFDSRMHRMEMLARRIANLQGITLPHNSTDILDPTNLATTGVHHTIEGCNDDSDAEMPDTIVSSSDEESDSDEEMPDMVISSSDDESDVDDNDDDLGHEMRRHRVRPEHAPDPQSTYMTLSSLVTRLLHFDAERQEYMGMPILEDALKFYQSYSAGAPNRPKGVNMILVDSGSMCFLSPCDHHFPIEIECNTQITGIGGATIKRMAPQILSVLNVNATKYIDLTFERGYRLDSLRFAILPTGPLEKRGFKFVLKHNNPYLTTPEGDKAHLIKDYATGYTWLAERPQARSVVMGKRFIIEELTKGPSVDVKKISEGVIGDIEEMPSIPDSKENIDRELGFLTSVVTAGYQGGSETEPNLVGNDDDDVDSEEQGDDAGYQSEEESRQLSRYVHQAEIKAARRVRPVFMKVPTQRVLSTGDLRKCEEFKRYLHDIGGHLEWGTLLEAADFIEGGEIIKAIDSVSRQHGLDTCPLHCDACARMKAKVRSTPSKRTTRPTREEPPGKIHLDASGMMDTKSIFHNYLYYLLGRTEFGFFLIQFMSYKSQTLFQIARMFSEAGGAPRSVGIDGAGELTSQNASKFFAHHKVAVEGTVPREHWQLGSPERGHGVLKPMARCVMAHACAPRAFWSFAIKHMALTANLLLRARDPKTHEKLDKTLWEAHYGEKPDVHRYLVAPWGSLGYITLTKEARDARGFDKTWGPRAIGGVFLGCHVNPRTSICYFMIHDGSNIISTSSDLRVVPDCFPFRWQRGRDIQLRLTPPDDDEDEDESVETERRREEQEREATDVGRIVWVKIDGYPTWPCALWTERSVPTSTRETIVKQKKEGSRLVYTLGDHMFMWVAPNKILDWNGPDHDQLVSAGPKKARSIAIDNLFKIALQEADEECKRPGTHLPRLGGEEIAQIAMEAFITHDKQVGRELAFAGRLDVEAQKGLQSRATTRARQGAAPDGGHQKQLHRSIAEHAADGPIDREQYLKETTDQHADDVDFENPLDFVMEATPDEFVFETPYEGGRYHIMEPVDFSDHRRAPREVRHPAHGLVGRRVRKRRTVSRRRDRIAKSEITGTVVTYNERTSLFRLKYSDGVEEQLDLVNLKQILILDKKHGDPAAHHGKTRAEIQAAEIEDTVCAAIWEEYIFNRTPAGYGEGEEATGQRVFQTSLKPPKPKGALRTSGRGDHGSLDKKSVKFSQDVLVLALDQNSTYDESEWPAVNVTGNRLERDKERKQGYYDDRAFFYPQELQHTSFQVASRSRDGGDDSVAEEYEEVPRDDEPRNKKEADRHRCLRCRKDGGADPCERCLEERKGIYECWDKEMKQLRDMEVIRDLTEEEIQKVLQEKRKILSAKMVTKRKYEAWTGRDGIVRDRFLKFKGRLACVGTREEKGVDMPWSTFSPVIGMVAVRTVMSMMCRDDFHVNAYDLSGAFLAADLDRPVYMKLPAECGESAGKIVKCLKAIYGLKTSSKDYVDAFSKKILEFEHDGCKFERLQMDACIFRFIGKNGEEIILCHYVDDLIVGTNNLELREKLLSHIREKWAVTDEGEMSRFVGLNFARKANGRRWELSCTPYIERIGARFGADDGRYFDTPMDSGFVVTPEDLKEEATAEMMSEYRSLIGSLGFAATTVRYDIAYAVSVLSRYLMNPNRKVIDAAKRVVRYLLKTKDFKIVWSTEEGEISSDRVNKMWGAVDASFASDLVTRRSHSGFLIFNNGGCISWKSGLQKLVTLSSCESEFVGLCSAVVEIRYLRQLMEELGKPQQEGTVLWEDNKACIILAEGETSSGGRSKHIDVKFRYIAENVKSGEVCVRYIPTSWNYADMMTKPLGKIQFRRVRDMCVAPEASGVQDSGEEVDMEVEMANLIYELEGY